MKKILFLNQYAPYSGQAAQTIIDLLLSASVYDQEIAVLFLGEGVWQLLTNQQHVPNIAKNLKGLKEFGIHKLYVDKQALTERNLLSTNLAVTTEALSPSEIQALFKQHDMIFNF